MNAGKDVLKLHFAVALLGLAGVIGKFVSWPATAVTFGRVFFSSVFLIIVVLIKKESVKLLCRKDYLLMIAAGVIMAVHWTTFIQSIQVSSVAIGTITFASFPLFVTFLEPMIYKEKLKAGNVIISVIMLVGVAITVPELSLSNNTTVGVIWGMIGSFTYAVLSLMNRYFAGRYSGRLVCLYEQGTATVVLLPFIFMTTISFTTVEVGSIIFMGVVCTAIAHSIFVASLSKVKVHTAGIISGMETVYSIVFAMILLHDMVTLREVIGGVVILSAAMYKTFQGKGKAG